MKQINKILVVFNPFAENNVELEHALKLASITQAKIDLIAFRHRSEYQVLSRLNLEFDVKGRIASETLQLLEKKVKLYEQTDNIRLRVEWCDSVAESIIQLVNSENYDLLIKSPNQSSILKNIIATPTDWNILRACNCPVWFAKPQADLKADIVAAIDIDDSDSASSSLENQVIHQASFLSHLLGSKLHVVNAFPGLPAAAHLQFVSIYENDYLKEIQQQHQTELNRMLASYDVPENYRHVQAGDADEVLSKYVKDNNVSILVIGNAAREGLKGILSGNTAERILSKVECDILVVKCD